MAFIGYSIQAFLNISVIDVAPYYFIIIGLILSECYKKENDKTEVKKTKSTKNKRILKNSFSDWTEKLFFIY